MRIYEELREIVKIQKFRRFVSYTGFYCFATLISYAYVSNTTRAGYSRADQFYASYPAGTELLTDTTKLYKAALGNCFEVEEWSPFEYCIMAKHFERQGKSPYAYHAQYMAHLLSLGQLDGNFQCSKHSQCLVLGEGVKNNEEAKVSREEAFEEGLCHMVQKLVNILKQIDPKDPFRIDMTDKLLEKLYNMGVIPTRQSITLCERLTMRRLTTVSVRLKFAEHLKRAVTYIEQGHIRVGPESVTDPAFLVN
ncbi:unnamed protein product [Sphenostylis stenocarpa]|uniref:Ribosomal protein S4 n=1 Tax=Sphenostylis stenocarpa TaxID=92480 RepID=A0AA86RT84_9FABA|nr:unnamed protein product [Sphenostylis stenocarpa]